MAIYVSPKRWEFVEKVTGDSLVVSVAEIKESARMDAGETLLDSVIEKYIKAAQSKIERWAGLTLLETRFKGYYDSFPVVMRLNKTPHLKVEKIEYIATDGTVKEVDPLIYQIQTFEHNSNIFTTEKSYPRVKSWTVDSVFLTVVAGWEDAGSVPEDIKSAITASVVKMFQGDCGDNAILTKGALSLLRHYKNEISWLE